MIAPKVTDSETLKALNNSYTYNSLTGDLLSNKLKRPLVSSSDSGYLRISVHIRNETVYIKAHHICWFMYYGEWPSVNIDHINSIKTDNRIANLRLAASQQNSFNARKTKAKTTSLFKGVAWHKVAKKWRAYITLNNKHIHIGLFSSEIEAAQAYNHKAKLIFGSFAKTNEINT